MRQAMRFAGLMLAVAVILSGCTTASINHPPAIVSWDPRGDLSMPQESTMAFRINATDQDGQALTCRWFVDGSHLSTVHRPFVFEYSSGTMAGAHTVTAVVSDGSLTALRTWKVEVYAVNHAPVISSSAPGRGPLAVNEGGSLRFTANVSDPDGDPLVLLWMLDGLRVLDNSTSYLFEPGFAMAGAHTVRISSSDGNATSEIAWNVTVVNVDRPPTITGWSPQGDVHIRELESQRFSVSAEDADGDAVNYSWSVDGAPAMTGPDFDFTTGYSSAGNHTVAVAAGDGTLETARSWNIRVDNVNRPPGITGFAPSVNVSLSEWESATLSVAASDDDGDELSASWYVDNGSAARGTGMQFQYLPGYDSAGVHTVRVELTDGTDVVSRFWNISVTREVADWTVLVYMNADDDLEPYLLEDFNEMERTGSTPNVNIVVQLDRSPSYDNSNGDWSGARRYRVEKDGDDRVINSTLLTDLGPTDMGAGATFRDFLLWGVDRFPAQRYQLVMSGHGDGWMGISQDFSSGNDRLTIDEVASGLRSFAAARNGTPAEVLELDVCYLAMLETDWGLRDGASYIVASEDIDPSSGQTYNLYLDDLAANPGMAPGELAARLVGAFAEGYSGGGGWPEDDQTFTQSAVETARLPELVSALDAFCGIVTGNMSALAPRLAQARAGVDAYGKPDFIDLYRLVQLLRGLSDDGALNSSADAVMAAIGGAVVAESHGTHRAGSHGISIYFPSESYSYKAGYAELSYSREHSWNGLLSGYYNSSGRSAECNEAGAARGRGAPAGASPQVTDPERKTLNPGRPDNIAFTVKGGI
jgi:hypothetical protein